MTILKIWRFFHQKYLMSILKIWHEWCWFVFYDKKIGIFSLYSRIPLKLGFGMTSVISWGTMWVVSGLLVGCFWRSTFLTTKFFLWCQNHHPSTLQKICRTFDPSQTNEGKKPISGWTYPIVSLTILRKCILLSDQPSEISLP